MLNHRHGLFAPLAILPIIALTNVSCGGKSKDNSAKPSAESVETFIVDARITDGKTQVTYRSNIKDARFKCMLQPKAAPQAGSWQDCAKEGLSVDVIPGVDYVVRVKAVSPSGTESTQPAERVIAAGNGGNGSQTFMSGDPDDSAQGPVTMEATILNQADIKNPFDKSTLRLAFGINGPMRNTDDLVFECKESPSTTYTACSGKDYHVVQNLTDNMNYSLSVRAVHRPTKSISKAAKVSFSVKLNTLMIEGADRMETQKTGRVNLRIGQGNERLTCTLNGKPVQQCTSNMVVDLDRMPAGSHQYVFTTDSGLSSTINFCAQTCSGGGNSFGQTGSYNSGQPVTHQIGSFYAFTVDPGLHVTQYATSKTYNNSLSFYRITNDPFYVGVDNCNLQDPFGSSVGRLIKQASPAGVDYDYCARTPSREYYKIMTEGRSANNHIEVATDANIVEQNPWDQERILINVFDSDYEFMIERSRFEALCAINMNMRGRISKSPFVPVMGQGFWGNGVFSEIFACNGKLPTTGGGLPTMDQGGWWVGAFYISTNDALPSIECFRNDYRAQLAGPGPGAAYAGNITPQFCGSYKNPGMIEVVYMTKRPFQTDYDFMQAMQNRIRGNLREVTPRLQIPGIP
jgi:hypothetical protein